MEFRVSSTAPAKFHMSFSPKKEVNRKENTVGKIAMVTDSKGCYLKKCLGNSFTQYSFYVMEFRVSSICTRKISYALYAYKRGKL